jgi:alpha-mannosidase
MTFKDLIVLLPCQSLENLSLDRDGAEAEQLLSAWTALYHPAVLAQASGMPRWASAESPPEDVASSLVVLPECAEGSLAPDWADAAEKAGARVIRRLTRRDEVIAAALEGVAEGAPLRSTPLSADFLSLGFCHFVVELLTRQLRYMSNLDSERFQRHALDALQHLVQGDEPAAREQLRAAFDRLTEAREYFYLTLVADTTLGDSLRRELASEGPVNLLISGAVVERMAEQDPASLSLLKVGLEKGTVTLVGGEYDEQELPLMAPEGIVGQFQRGLEAYERCLGHRPTIFGRRRFGLSPMLPQILKSFGFVGALHFTLDDGRFPSGNQSKIRWEGIDGTDIEALARIPLEVDRPENFLRLPSRLGNTLDADQGATVVFAHWAGQTSPWFEDLRRMGQYGPGLGKFTTLATYFQNTMYSGQAVRHAADKYRSPYLKQAIAAEEPDPISRWVRYHRQCVLAGDVQTMRTLSGLIRGDCPAAPASQDPAEAAGQLAASIKGPQTGPNPGLLFLNPRSRRVRWPVEAPGGGSLPEVALPVVAAAEAEGHRQVLLEVPAMGFAWVGAPTQGTTGEKPKAASKAKEEPPLVGENVLRNEYLQAQVSPTTGAIQSLQSYAIRGNRLAQQIAMRLPPPAELEYDVDPEAEENYSLMAADEITASMLGPMVGRIVSRGRLMDRAGKRLASFVQTMIVRRGSPLLELEIDLDLKRLPEPSPWKSYCAIRFAWSDETADVFHGVGLCRQPSDGKFLESPHFIDIRSPRTQLTILSGGLPYHRRYGVRKLDTLLVVHGETARKFRLGIGVDVRYPAHAAMEVLAQPPECYPLESAPRTPWGWLFHLDARNVLATHWEPLVANGRATGFRVRLLETEGRHSELALRSFRPLASARKVDFLGGLQSELPVDADQVTVELRPREWIQVEAAFSS